MSDSFTFNLDDLVGDIESLKESGDLKPEKEFVRREAWPFAEMGILNSGKVLTAQLGKGSVTIRNRTQPDAGGTRPYDYELSVPAIIEFNGQKYSSFIRWSTGGPSWGLREFVKTLELFKTTDPVIAAARSANAVVKGWFKAYQNPSNLRADGTPWDPQLQLSNFEFVEFPGIAVTSGENVKIRDLRDGKGGGKSQNRPTVPDLTGSTPPAATAPVPSVPVPNVDADGVVQSAPSEAKPFWEE